ncbi:DUF454 family protein [bacterium]|nr:DUF454 family protein [bacterium]
MKKTIFIIFGTLSLILGIIGIFIPVLPTTPFILLTSWLYLKSSQKLYSWLLSSRFFKNYRNTLITGKLSKKSKLKSLILMNIMILISIISLQNIIAITIIIVLAVVGNIVLVLFF